MTNRYIVASDLGSGGCKTVVMNAAGRVVAAAQQEYSTSYPHPGWVEQDPEDWYAALCATIRAALQQAEVMASQVAGVGLVGVTHNAVLLDERDRPLAPSILMFDTRTTAEVQAILARWGGEVFERTLNGPSPVWTWPQLLWTRLHRPGLWKSVRRIVFQKDYCRHRLAPSPVTDTIDAGGTLLFDPQRAEWIRPFCEDLELDPAWLPEVVEPFQVVGRVSASGAADTGLEAGTPVICGTTDTAAEMLGSGALRPGAGIVKLASVGRIAVVTREPMRVPHILNYRHVLDGLWYPGTASKYAASAYRWLRDLIWPDLVEEAYRLMDEAAAQAPAGSDGLVFHPHLMGEWAPHWNEMLRGDFVGLTARHTRAHLTRAVLEGVAFALKDALTEMESRSLKAEAIRLIGQGSKSALWGHIVSNVLNRPLCVPEERDAVYGAALITGIGVGLIPGDVESLQRLIAIRRTIEPQSEAAQAYATLFEIYREADRVLAPLAARLYKFEQQQAARSEVAV